MPRTITVHRQCLLNVVRKLDFGAYIEPVEFDRSFDNLREAFTEDELVHGTALENKTDETAYEDGRPYSTDMFLRHLWSWDKDCYMRDHRIACWMDGRWKEATRGFKELKTNG